jgi:hypothetical protein
VFVIISHAEGRTVKNLRPSLRFLMRSAPVNWALLGLAALGPNGYRVSVITIATHHTAKAMLNQVRLVHSYQAQCGLFL